MGKKKERGGKGARRGEGQSEKLRNRGDLEFISLRGQFYDKMSFNLF